MIDKLKRAKSRIEDPKNWCVHEAAVYRKDENGSSWADLPNAKRLCAIGALWAESVSPSADRPRGHVEAERLLNRAAEEQDAIGIIDLNHRGDHAAVIRAYDRAIELAGAV